ncbi:MAG: N-acetyltransferase [Oligoflexia bacterium]|nr:N-acetyltransferase [Oligoflexia bacterium]
MKYEIWDVVTEKDWEAFIDLPWKIYAGDPNWVPPLRVAVRDILNVDKNPFFKHARMKPMLVFRGEEVVGRVVGVIDDRHNEFHNEKTVFFGFYESIDDQEVADVLLDAVVQWARSCGMKTLRGPMNPSTNHECGLLVEGFNDPPQVMMTYNPAYYIRLFERFGLAKSKDLFAYEIDTRKNKFAERLIAQAERVKRKSSVTFRTIDMKRFDQEIEGILGVYNDAWEKNWGFVPMDREEFIHMAKDLKQILDPRLLIIAEKDDEMIGFALTIPDANQAIHKVKDGKLMPTGLVKLLWNLKGPGRRKTVNRIRVITLGIKRAYQHLGLGPMFYMEYFKLAPQLGYPTGEASWILEDNKPMNKALQLMCGEHYKTYRIYDKSLV